jgi:hypothetical protein
MRRPDHKKNKEFLFCCHAVTVPNHGLERHQKSNVDMENADCCRLIFGRKVPMNTSVSYQVDDGMLVPVIWHLGPVYCGYCANYKSLSLQSLTKHMQRVHAKELKDHAREVKRQTLNVPVGEDGLSLTFEFPSDSVKRKESTESCANESGLLAPQLQENDGKRMFKKRRQLPVQKKDV